MPRRIAALLVCAGLAPTVAAAAPAQRDRAAADGAVASSCYAELDRRGVAYRRVSRRGIAQAVEITGALGGLVVRYRQPLVIDCSLAVSLDEAGAYLRDLGMDTLGIASAYSRRNVRGTNRPSKHSYGLAVDISELAGPQIGDLRISRDYEQGLGDDVDCVGSPMTAAGEVLKIAQCQLVRSGLFFLALSPDYDDAHHDHFHLEALPWERRDQLRSASPAIH